MSDLHIIREKKRALASKIAARDAAHDESMAPLRKEFSDYETTERVLVGLVGEDEGAPERVTNGSGAIVPSKGRKPPGLPVMSEMIFEALEKAKANGEPGLAPSQILAYVRENHWRDAQSNDVGSTVWRMWKHSQLRKDGKIYKFA